MTLAALYSAWAGGTENILEIFHFYPFGLPIAPTVLGVGGTELPIFGMVIGLSLFLTKFVFDFRYSAEVQKYGGLKMIWAVIWAKIWDSFPVVKNGAA